VNHSRFGDTRPAAFKTALSCAPSSGGFRTPIDGSPAGAEERHGRYPKSSTPWWNRDPDGMKPAPPVYTAGNNHPLVWLKHGLTILHRKEATPVLSVKRRDWGSTGMNRAIGRGGRSRHLLPGKASFSRRAARSGPMHQPLCNRSNLSGRQLAERQR